jgi:hypothetical protein
MLDPNHPSLLTGRRHGRELIEAAARVVRVAGETKTAPAVETLSTALQLTVSAALVDGFEPHEAYEAASAFLAWLVCRLPEKDQLGVLTAMTSEVVQRVQFGNVANSVAA